MAIHHSEVDKIKLNVVIKYVRDVGCKNVSELNWLGMKARKGYYSE
jgi:hypothetical protein